jgi:hypothetical protein
MLDDAAYDSGELRGQLDERGTKPVIPNRCNRKLPFTWMVLSTSYFRRDGAGDWPDRNCCNESNELPCITQAGRFYQRVIFSVTEVRGHQLLI